jgi:hypothetical protein
VITVEPLIAMGTGEVTLDRDGWTLRTPDGSLAVHCEHTAVITRGQPILLTQSEPCPRAIDSVRFSLPLLARTILLTHHTPEEASFAGVA